MKKAACFLILFVFISTVSCTRYYIHRIIKNKDEIANLARDKDIVVEHERKHYTLRTYKVTNGSTNEYFFEKEEDGTYTLKRDTIEFRPDDIINIDPDRDNYPIELCDYYQKVTQILEFYNIQGLIGRKYKNYPNLEFTIFLNNGNIVEYMSETDDRNDIERYKEIEKGWFLYKGKP